MTEARSEAEWREWAKIHRACWEVSPLIERHDGQNLQVGFQFTIMVQFPPSATDAATRRDAFPILSAQMEELVAVAFPAEGPIARFEAGPVEPSVRMRPETGFAMETQITCSVFHKDEYFSPVVAGERQRLAPLEKRLKELGLQAKSWGRAQ